MKVSISSLYQVAKNIGFIKENNLNLISIRDSNPSLTDKMLWKEIDDAKVPNMLVVHFDDIIDAIPLRSEIPPHKNDIIAILGWASQKIKENGNPFVVHCTAGISRSSSVAILVKYLSDPDKALSVINPVLHSPNEKVLEIGEEVLGANGILDGVKKMMEDSKEDFLKGYDKESL